MFEQIPFHSAFTVRKKAMILVDNHMLFGNTMLEEFEPGIESAISDIVEHFDCEYIMYINRNFITMRQGGDCVFYFPKSDTLWMAKDRGRMVYEI